MGHSSACLKFIKQVRYKLLTGGELVEKEENKIVTNDKRKKEIIQRLRAMNYRITSQRMLLLDIILNGQYSSCKEIYCEVHKKDSNIGIATVYRMVNTLEEIGAISRKNMYRISAVASSGSLDCTMLLPHCMKYARAVCSAVWSMP